jgi:hypothetical protein
MKAEILETGKLVLTPESNTESYALEKWFETHLDGCSFLMKPLDLRKDIAGMSFRPLNKTKISFLKRLKFWL